MHDKLVALVTGANQGIGLQTVKDLAAHGYTVLLGSRNLPNGEAAAQTIGAAAHALQLDVTKPDSIAAAAAHIRQTFGKPPSSACHRAGRGAVSKIPTPTGQAHAHGHR